MNSNDLTRFGREVVHAYHNRGYVGAIISGEFAKGKTTSAIHMGREIMQFLYNLNELDAYRRALDSILFTMDDVLKQTSILKTVDWQSLSPQEVLRKKYEIRKPFFIWDDAGVHGSKYKHFFNMGDTYELQSNFDTIRDVTSCMIITVPEDEELLKFLRSYRSHYFVEIINVGGGRYNRRLEFYKYRKDKMGRKRKRLQWRTPPFSIYVKKEIYGEYDRRRTLAKIENSERYEKKKQMRDAKAKYYEMKQQYFKKKMESELAKMGEI